MTKKKNKDFSSFRDPAGYIYYENNLVYRYINSCYFKQYDSLNKTGLFQELIEKGYLISHKEIIRDVFFPTTFTIPTIPFWSTTPMPDFIPSIDPLFIVK